VILDTNAWVGQWPFHPFPVTTPAQLADHLSQEGIDKAWVAPADAVLFPDPQLGNERWLPELSRYPSLVPVVIIDPTYANWRESLKRAAGDWGAQAVKLVPTYRCFSLDDSQVDELIQTATSMGLTISIQMRLEDERRHHPLMKVAPLDPSVLLELSRRHPETMFHIACAYLPELRRLAEAENLVFEISSLEVLDTIRSLLEIVSPERLCFGSHTPFYYTRSAVLKMQTADVAEDVLTRIAEGVGMGTRPGNAENS